MISKMRRVMFENILFQMPCLEYISFYRLSKFQSKKLTRKYLKYFNISDVDKKIQIKSSLSLFIEFFIRRLNHQS